MFSYEYELQRSRQDGLRHEADQWRLAHQAAAERRAQRQSADRRAAARGGARGDAEGAPSRAAGGGRHRTPGAHGAALTRVRHVLRPRSAA